MYSVLKLSWEEVTKSDLILKSNNARKVVEIEGSNMKEDSYSENSSIIIYYDMMSGKPLFLVERFESFHLIDLPSNVINGFVTRVDFNKEQNYCDITVTRGSLYDAIMESEK